MICLARPLKASEAAERGIVGGLAEEYADLIDKAVAEVHSLQTGLPRMADGKLDLPPLALPEPPMAAGQPLSREAVAITVKTIQAAAGPAKLKDALEIGYNATSSRVRHQRAADEIVA